MSSALVITTTTTTVKDNYNILLTANENESNKIVKDDYPLLTAKKKLSLKIDENDPIWIFFKKMESAYWISEETRFEHFDVQAFQNLAKYQPAHRFILKHILCWFGVGDGLVNENLGQISSMIRFNIPEMAYHFIMVIENTHKQVYSRAIHAFALSPAEETQMLEMFDDMDNITDEKSYTKVIDDNGKEQYVNDNAAKYAIRNMVEYAQKWCNSDSSFAERLLVFSNVEGLFFQVTFCIIKFICDHNGHLTTLLRSNEFIERDEEAHVDFAALIFNTYVPEEHRPSQEWHHKQTSEVVDILTHVYTKIIPCSLISLNPNEVAQYTKFLANYNLLRFGYDRLYYDDLNNPVKNPFKWMEDSVVRKKPNFFETKNTEYEKIPVETFFSQQDLEGITP